MTRYDFTPRSRMQLLDGAFTLLRQHLGLLVAIASIFFSFNFICRLILAQAMLGRWDTAALLRAGPLAVSLNMAIATLFGSISAGALAWAVSELLLGREPRAGEAARVGLKRGWALLAFNLLFTLAFSLGTVLLIVPGIIVLLNWALATQAIMVENMSVARAVRRSRGLVRGHRATVAALGGAAMVLVSAFTIGCSHLLPRLFSSTPFLASLIGEIPSLVVGPIFPCLSTLLYYDLRVRKEAYDLELAATDGAASSNPAAP